MSKRDYSKKYIVCFECKEYVRLRKRHLYDKARKAFRCQSCWDLYMNNDYQTKREQDGKDTRDSLSRTA